MVPTLLRQIHLEPWGNALQCLGKSPCRDRPLLVQTCGKQESCQLASRLDTHQPDMRKRPVQWSSNYFFFFLIIPRQVCNFAPSTRATNCRSELIKTKNQPQTHKQLQPSTVADTTYLTQLLCSYVSVLVVEEPTAGWAFHQLAGCNCSASLTHLLLWDKGGTFLGDAQRGIPSSFFHVLLKL